MHQFAGNSWEHVHGSDLPACHDHQHKLRVVKDLYPSPSHSKGFPWSMMTIHRGENMWVPVAFSMVSLISWRLWSYPWISYAAHTGMDQLAKPRYPGNGTTRSASAGLQVYTGPCAGGTKNWILTPCDFQSGYNSTQLWLSDEPVNSHRPDQV